MQRPGPHAVYTPDNSICYGEYFISPATLVHHVTSFAATCIGDSLATNDTIRDALPLYLALVPWWFSGDISGSEVDFDPSGTCPSTVLRLYH